MEEGQEEKAEENNEEQHEETEEEIRENKKGEKVPWVPKYRLDKYVAKTKETETKINEVSTKNQELAGEIERLNNVLAEAAKPREKETKVEDTELTNEKVWENPIDVMKKIAKEENSAVLQKEFLKLTKAVEVAEMANDYYEDNIFWKKTYPKKSQFKAEVSRMIREGGLGERFDDPQEAFEFAISKLGFEKMKQIGESEDGKGNIEDYFRESSSVQPRGKSNELNADEKKWADRLGVSEKAYKESKEDMNKRPEERRPLFDMKLDK